MSASNGRVDLTNGATLLDRIGYGTANLYETAPAPTLNNTTALQRKIEGVDTDNNFADFQAAAPTPKGATVTPGDDQPTSALIHTVQGSGSTAQSGSFHFEGIVTAILPTWSPASFYIQEEDADADADMATSEGIFVASTTPVTVGDKVSVNGTVQENSAAPSFDKAVISASTISVISSGNSLPLAVTVTLPLTAITD